MKFFSPWGGAENTIPSVSTWYTSVSGDGIWTGTESEVQCPVAVAFTLSAMAFSCKTAPGASQQWVVTVRKNGVDTSATLSINQFSNGIGPSTFSINFAAGDLISIKITVVGTPTATGLYGYIVGDTAGQSYPIFTGGCVNPVDASATTYFGVCGDTRYWGTTEATKAQLIPIDCTLRNMRVHQSVAGGGTSTQAYTVMLNGVATALTTTLNNAATTGSDTTHSVTVVGASDAVSIKRVPTNTPTGGIPCIGMEVVPATGGQSFVTYATDEGISPNSGVTYQNPMGGGNTTGTWQVAESTVYSNWPAVHVSGLKVRVGSGPGVGQSFTYKLRVVGTDSGVSTQISGASTAASTSPDYTMPADNSPVTISSTPSASPGGLSSLKLALTVDFGNLVLPSGGPQTHGAAFFAMA